MPQSLWAAEAARLRIAGVHSSFPSERACLLECRRENQILWVTGSAVQPSAGSSFLTFVSRRSLQRSAPTVKSHLCSSARRITQNRAVLAYAPLGSAPEIDSASLRSFPSPIMKRLFLLAVEAQLT